MITITAIALAYFIYMLLGYATTYLVDIELMNPIAVLYYMLLWPICFPILLYNKWTKKESSESSPESNEQTQM